MDNKLQHYLHEVLISIHANIRDLKEKKSFADPEELDYIEGRLFSYHEMLSIFKMTATEMGINEEDVGL